MLLLNYSLFFLGNCKNNRGGRLCEKYKGYGYCTKYAQYMSKNCKKSCNKCSNGKFFKQ